MLFSLMQPLWKLLVDMVRRQYNLSIQISSGCHSLVSVCVNILYYEKVKRDLQKWCVVCVCVRFHRTQGSLSAVQISLTSLMRLLNRKHQVRSLVLLNDVYTECCDPFLAQKACCLSVSWGIDILEKANKGKQERGRKLMF